VRRDTARLGQNLTALNVVPLDAAEQTADVVASLTTVEQLFEHLHARDDGLARGFQAHDFDFIADLDDPTLDTARRHRTATFDREYVLDGHQERLVHRPLGLGNKGVDGIHQFLDAFRGLGIRRILVSRQSGTVNDGRVIAREAVLVQQLPDLQFDQLQQLGVVHQVALVEKYDQRGHGYLASQQDVLASLRHGAVRR